MLPPTTWSPLLFIKGTDSPVRRLSSTVVSPSIISPSTGIISPTITLKKSFSWTSLIGISILSWFLFTISVFGIRLFIDSDVFTDSFITLSSIALPMSKKETIKAPVSRNILFPLDGEPTEEISSAGNSEINKELKLPSEIKVSMLKSRFLIFLNADIWKFLPRTKITKKPIR